MFVQTPSLFFCGATATPTRMPKRQRLAEPSQHGGTRSANVALGGAFSTSGRENIPPASGVDALLQFAPAEIVRSADAAQLKQLVTFSEELRQKAQMALQSVRASQAAKEATDRSKKRKRLLKHGGCLVCECKPPEIESEYCVECECFCADTNRGMRACDGCVDGDALASCDDQCSGYLCADCDVFTCNGTVIYDHHDFQQCDVQRACTTCSDRWTTCKCDRVWCAPCSEEMAPLYKKLRKCRGGCDEMLCPTGLLGMHSETANNEAPSSCSWKNCDECDEAVCADCRASNECDECGTAKHGRHNVWMCEGCMSAHECPRCW